MPPASLAGGIRSWKNKRKGTEKMASEAFLIVGLGNPGKEYERTRHNVGFVAIDYLAQTLGVKITKLKFHGAYGETFINGKKCILLKPHTYMNSSGESVREAAEFFKTPPKNIIVMYDDVVIPPGTLRIRPSGSAGGHNGMKSIIYQLNSDEFPRIRFGVGAPKSDMVNHVLGNFSHEDGVKVTSAVKNTDAIISMIIDGKIADAMSRYNNKEF